MANALQINGAQSEKPVKATPLYVGRQTTGLWTNRSPLRDANTGRISEKYYGPSGDALIAGSNVEVTNRLTLTRRPGNPQYDGTNTYSNIIAFDEFRYSKSLSDIWGTTIEQIDTMVDTSTALYANNNGSSQLVWTKTTGAGQDFMQEVGTQLYFGNGIDQKKWNQSLFVRQVSNNSSVINTDAYPFMSTFLIDSNGNIEQLIGVQIAQITAAAVSGDVLTLTLAAKLGQGYNATPAGGQQAEGVFFTIWGLTGDADVLNGQTLALNTQAAANTTSLTFNFTSPNFSVTGLTGILQVANGVTTGVADDLSDVVITSVVTTGSSVPTWGTTVPAIANNFQGSITVDGNAVWVNRGNPVENWGIDAPTTAPTYTAQGTSEGWQSNTYYSLGSIFQDANGYLWQISTPGLTGSTLPNFTGSTPTTQRKFDIKKVTVVSSVATFVTSLQSPALVAGQVVELAFLGPAAALNGQLVTVLSSGLTTTAFEANVTGVTGYATAVDDGYGAVIGHAANPTTTIADGSAVWTAIQTPASLTWTMGTHYWQNDFILATAAGTPSFFQLQRSGQNNYPTPQATLSGALAESYYHLGQAHGAVNFYYPAGTATSTGVPTSLHWNTSLYPAPGDTTDMMVYPVNGAGAAGTPGVNISSNNAGAWAITGKLYIPEAGSYTFNLVSDDGGFFSFDDVSGNGCFKVSGTFTDYASPVHTSTVLEGYGSGAPAGGATGQNLCGTNGQTTRNSPSGQAWLSTAVWSFPTPGEYAFEIDYANWQGSGSGSPGAMWFTCNGGTILSTVGYDVAIRPDKSSASSPAFPAFTTSGATWDATANEIVFGTGNVAFDASHQYVWVNIGPLTNFTWTKQTTYTLPDTGVVDSNGNEEGPIRTGITGSAPPKWNTNLNGITLDNGTLGWINEGPIPNVPTEAGKITATSAQGWIYALALVNTIDNTVSNIGPLSAATGPLVNGTVTFAPGSGLILSQIDPQSDYVAIFRTTDGFPTELLIPGNGNTIYTIPLSTYLTYGYVDTTPDVGLDEQATAPAAYQNTPPLPGAINLTYHLNRTWFSIGNTVFWTSGPDDPIGNGINGFGPNNYDKMPSLVKKLVPTAIGMLVFTVSDVYNIPDNQGTILPSVPYMPGIGLSSYNALDTNGPDIGFFTTDSQFIKLSPAVSGGIESVPIADQLSMRNGTPGQNWYPGQVYVAHYASGQDMGWFLADGTNGWYRLMSTPTPEPAGMIWSPFATLANTGGCGAIKSVETSPGVHHLLVGPRGTGVYILNRDILSSTDGGPAMTYNGGATYPAYAVYGSYVLAQPGQVALVQFVTLKSVLTGSPAILGLLLDDGLPYYKGSFEILKNWVNDPPELKPSRTWYTQRFYLSDMPEEAGAVTDIQIMVQWPAEAAINELQTFSIFGSFVQEQ
jgi:hypothetical protein